MAIRERLIDRSRNRRFSNSRAGNWSRSIARRQRLDYTKRHWLWLVLEAVMLFAIGAIDLLVPHWIRQFFAGAWVTGVVWFIWYQIVVESGSATAEMGAVAEEQTAWELRLLVDRGWRVMSHVVLRTADIDHVAIGPGGTLVIETKWRSNERAFGTNLEWFDFSRLRRAARDITLMLQTRLRGSPTQRVVVLRGPVARDAEILSRAPDDVVVVSGANFGEWLNSIPDSGITPDLVADAWTTLEQHVTKRDVWELKRNGPDPRGVSSWLFEGLLAVATGLIGFLTCTYALRLIHVPGFWVVTCALLVLGWLGTRVDRLRLVGIAWMAGVGGFTCLLVTAYGYELLRRVA